jgi:hypothetical protein
MRAHKVEAAGLKRGALRAALEGTRKGKVKCTSYRLHPSMCFAYFSARRTNDIHRCVLLIFYLLAFDTS